MCEGVLGWFFGHKFEPRYDYMPPVGMYPNFTNEKEMVFFVEHLVTRYYYGDLCVRCGKLEEVKRENYSKGKQ